MSEDYIVHEHDVVIIGAGGAGLRAAIEASNSGVSVAMICKSMLGIIIINYLILIKFFRNLAPTSPDFSG